MSHLWRRLQRVPMMSHATTPIEALSRAIRAAWSAETSFADDWDPEHPSVGQCAVTALVIQDFFGGDLLRSEVGGVSHYWNRLPDGSEVDLTRDQFVRFVLDRATEVRDRGYVLSFPQTALRYKRLRSAVGSTFYRTPV